MVAKLKNQNESPGSPPESPQEPPSMVVKLDRLVRLLPTARERLRAADRVRRVYMEPFTWEVTAVGQDASLLFAAEQAVLGEDQNRFAKVRVSLRDSVEFKKWQRLRASQARTEKELRAAEQRAEQSSRDADALVAEGLDPAEARRRRREDRMTAEELREDLRSVARALKDAHGEVLAALRRALEAERDRMLAEATTERTRLETRLLEILGRELPPLYLAALREQTLAGSPFARDPNQVHCPFGKFLELPSPSEEAPQAEPARWDLSGSEASSVSPERPIRTE